MFAVVGLIGFFGFFVYLIRLLICVLKKKPKKRNGAGLLVCLLLFFGGFAMTPDSGEQPAPEDPAPSAQSISDQPQVAQANGSSSEEPRKAPTPPAQSTPVQASQSTSGPSQEEKAQEFLAQQFDLELTDFNELPSDFEVTVSVDGVSSREDQTQAPDDWSDIQLRMISAQARLSEALEAPEKAAKLYLRDSNNELMLSVQGGKIIYDKYKQAEKPAAPSGSSAGTGTGNGSNFNTYDDPSQQQTSADYVLNTNTMKFHVPSCSSVAKIAPENYSTYSGTRDGAISKGYDPCGICKP